jgi:hypothetical protein
MKVFVSWSSEGRDLVNAVMAQLLAVGHSVFRPEDLVDTNDRLSEISAGIRSSDVVFALLATSSSPNVFFELGVAVGASVPTLIAAPAVELLPANLASVPFVQLTGDLLRDAQEIAIRVNGLEGQSLPRIDDFGTAEAALNAAKDDPSVLEALPPREFESLVAKLFEERGYRVQRTPLSQDTGGDLVVQPPDGTETILVEVKKLSRHSRVSVDAVRKLLGRVLPLSSSTVGMLVSSSGFTSSAVALAAGTPLVLRTLEEVLAAQSSRELVQSTGGNEPEFPLVRFSELLTAKGSTIRDFLSETSPDTRADAFAAVEFLRSRLRAPEHVVALGQGLYILLYRKVIVIFAITNAARTGQLSVALVGGQVAEQPDIPFGVVRVAPTLRDVTHLMVPPNKGDSNSEPANH